MALFHVGGTNQVPGFSNTRFFRSSTRLDGYLLSFHVTHPLILFPHDPTNAAPYSTDAGK